jgi:hypothetical protein
MGKRFGARRGAASAAVLGVLASVVIAACGGSSSPTSPSNYVGRAEAFEQCLAAHGVTASSVQTITTASGLNAGYLTKLEGAYNACRSQLGLKGIPSGVGSQLGKALSGL